MAEIAERVLAVTAKQWNIKDVPAVGRQLIGVTHMNIQPHIQPKGLYRWAELKPFLPIGESSWRKMVAAKAAPQPIKLSRKCTLWRGSEVLDWLEQPDTYEAKS